VSGEVDRQLSNISVALHDIGVSLAALVTIARFSIISDKGIDPLEHTAFEDHDGDSQEDDPK